ncbi:uncharacterized protein LOC133710010 isoform X2 [Rosa rugosa]|uniref:uncharacterized protein LOC133710010 isoform X2 n=1 Tax=Rosa rugosa TaxID=74645 RepID=UPI002B403B0F|nr:uncharacterized protein LOC133710010 isoform X2 [Rosa rugosa]
MPRPGPRPYECVRRAWHSDRHQPMRGSIIQQMFRVVSEVHSSKTKNNKEWQEKLPMVVLRAEEIMYSKANSEAEYMNSDTLWDRANDAINTIIRRDEGTETGDLLPPCVEAALNLGCVAVRASRSQRHSNPRSYLIPRPQEPPSPSPPSRILDRPSDERRPPFSPPHHPGNQSNFARPSAVSSAHLVPEAHSHANQSSNLTNPRHYPFSLENLPGGHNQVTTMSTNNQLNLGSVYPLYYGSHYQTEASQLGPQVPENAHSRTIYVGTPVTSIQEPTKQNIFTCQRAENVSHRIPQVDVMDIQEKPREAEYDLSLRLGPVSHLCTDRSFASETEDIGSSNSQEGGKFNDYSPSISKEFCFFPTKTAYDPSESTSSMWNSEGEDRSLEPTLKKRKATFRNNEEDGQFFCQPPGQPNKFPGRFTGPEWFRVYSVCTLHTMVVGKTG